MKKVQLVVCGLTLGAMVAYGGMDKESTAKAMKDARDKVAVLGATGDGYHQESVKVWSEVQNTVGLPLIERTEAVKQVSAHLQDMGKADEAVSALTEFLAGNPDLPRAHVLSLNRQVVAVKRELGLMKDDDAIEALDELGEAAGVTAAEKAKIHIQGIKIWILRGNLAKVNMALRKLIEKDLFSNDAGVPYDEIKNHILSTSVHFARKKMSDAGTSFVVHDGINPLEQTLAPVLQALNAPACVGLEKALRDLGATVPDQDRTDIKASVENWKSLVLVGFVPEVDWTESAKMVLGVAGYNAFVDSYNGTVAP